MTNRKFVQPANRREFIGKVTGAAALMGVASLVNPAQANDLPHAIAGNAPSPDDWFKTMKGKHRIVFDVTEPKEIFPFAWPKVFLMTNAGSGTPEVDCNEVVILRHNSIAYAMQDQVWAKYKLGEFFKINDPRTKAAAIRNPFWKTTPDDYKVPGIGAVQIGIPELQASGVMFCCCSVAIQVYSTVIAGTMNMDAAVVKKEWMDGLISGIQPMPSGVWAVNRAQENGCTYCYV
jgi:hypothetical protein